MNEQPDDVRAFARDVGIHALLISVGGLIVTGSVAALTLRAAGSMIKVALATTIVMICGSVAAWEVRKIQQQLVMEN